MGYPARAVVLFGLSFAAYLWLSATVPGGEKRYEHYIREAMDHGITTP